MQKLILVFLSAVLLGGCTLKNPFLKKPAGLEVISDPRATVFLNGREEGATPLTRHDLPSGSYTLQLVSEANPSSTWETKLDLQPKLTTIVNHTFAANQTDSFGYVLELRKEPGGATYLSVISDPDTVNLTIDGKPSGFTPVSRLESSPGAHELLLSSPGYQDLHLTVNVFKEYNLVVNVKLAPDLIVLNSPSPATSSASSSASLVAPSPSPTLPKPYVVILPTGTGWLRIRREPSSSSEELGKVDVGEQLKYLGESTETGWHKVEFEGAVGWLSGKYAKLTK